MCQKFIFNISSKKSIKNSLSNCSEILFLIFNIIYLSNQQNQTRHESDFNNFGNYICDPVARIM